MATPDFGTDCSSFPLPSTTFALISGYRVVAEALARRLSTPKGFLKAFPDYGEDLRQYLNEAVTDDMLDRARSEAVAECLQDERVDSITCTVTWTPATSTLLFRFQVLTSAGAFSFVLAVAQVTVDLYVGA